MLIKTIKYEDYNGVERNEDFMFNLTKQELMEMEMGTPGGLAEKIQSIIKAQNASEIIAVFKELILKSYGVKSPDGRQFMKVDDNGKPLSVAFSQTEAFSELFMELATNETSAAEFVNGIVPQTSDRNKEKVIAPKEFSTV